MRAADPLEPEMEAALEAIDSTLAGDPVDPGYAELAELALILRAERPAVGEPFAVAIDAQVRDRFATSDRRTRTPDGIPPAPRPARRWRRPRRGWLVWAPAGALVAVALVVALVTLVPGGGSGSSDNSFAASSASAGSAGVRSSPASASAAAADPSSADSSRNRAPTANNGATPVPPTAPGGGNRQVVQSARLALSTRPGKVDAVAQQVFDVVGSEKGYVANSSVTATGHPDSGADFSLSVPSANLQQTLIALTQLQGATVVSSANSSHDITGQVGGAGRRLAEARALLRSLLGRLANADTTEQIDSLKAQIRDANATIDRDQAALSGLHRQVQYSRIALTIQGSAPAAAGDHASTGSGSGFTLHRAGHDAVRVLVVAAGVLLIALAVAIPLALVAALVAWLWLRLRRHRRESALDRA
jgi:Domain of unknown function (DUF4349)